MADEKPDESQPGPPLGADASTGEAADAPKVPTKPVTAPPKAPAATPAAGAPPKAPAAKPAAGAEPKGGPSVPVGPSDPAPPGDLPIPAFIRTLQAALPDAVSHVSYFVGDWVVIVPVDRLSEVCRHLQSAPDALFDYCSDVTASDWPARPERFDVIYCLYSARLRHRLRVKVRAKEGQPVPSVTAFWPSANWLEREVFDLFGVTFSGHPDLRRILMPDEWQGHPQRKDYPLEGPGELLMENPLDWLRLRNVQDEAEIE